MTDEQIFKALEVLIKEQSDGYQTHLENGGKRDEIHEKFLEIMASLIEMFNRQKAEKEALIAGQETLQKYIAEQKAEIERLQKHIQEGIDLAKQIPEMVALAQAEAIKEFAERLKGMSEYGTINVSPWQVDNLVKEMVGDGGGSD